MRGWLSRGKAEQHENQPTLGKPRHLKRLVLRDFIDRVDLLSNVELWSLRIGLSDAGMLPASRGLGMLQRLRILRLPSHTVEDIRWHQSRGQSRRNTLPRRIQDIIDEAFALINHQSSRRWAMSKVHRPSPFWARHLELVRVDPFVARVLQLHLLHVIFKPSWPRIVRQIQKNAFNMLPLLGNELELLIRLQRKVVE